ncbi:MAG: T9SS type A sorting domain-containing protein [Candidatus Coatesbacteria bacterium]|nr:T9SS type A sorting domain-containing protein [Candidatus Coatesbacteria bacterium]
MKIFFVVLTFILIMYAGLFSSAPLYTYELRGITPELIAKLYKAGFDVAAILPNKTAHLLVTPVQIEKLKRLGYSGTILKKMIGGIDPDYLDYSEVYEQIMSLQTRFPGIVKYFDAGDSWVKKNGYPGKQTYYKGFDMLVAKVSDNVATDEDEPIFMIMGLHHAREPMSVSAVMYIMNTLVEGYSSVLDYKEWIDNYELWFLPIVNPDGYDFVFNSTDSEQQMWRKDFRDNNSNGVLDYSYGGYGADGVDLNRNYAYMWESGDTDPNSPTYRGPSQFSEPEIQIIRSFTLAKKPLLSLSFHSYGELVLWPWSCYSEASKKDAVFRKIGNAAATTMGYTGQRGYELYPTYGGSDDWLYAAGHTYAYTIELNSSDEGGFFPSAEYILPTIENAFEGTKEFLKAGLNMTQVTGKTYNKLNGKPIPNVLVEIAELFDNEKASAVFSNSFGSYKHLLVPGTYTLVAILLGDTPQSQTFTVAEGEIKVIDLYFTKTGFETKEKSYFHLPERVKISPNPFNDKLKINFNLKQTDNVEVLIYDITGRLVKSYASRSYTAGNHLITTDTSSFKNGVYIIKVRTGSREHTDKLIKLN